MSKNFKPRFNFPAKKYSKESKKMVSWRLNADLIKKLDQVADSLGMTVTEFVSVALDQAVVWVDKTNID